ncbi:nickel-binding protein, partial [Aeromonas veronii]|uniref:nickel-binding protein n=1 Tax=Aeromonas veronii TaxID=654 RepID=UPI0038B6AB02
MANELREYLILRELDDPISQEQLDGAAATSGETLEELRGEGVGIEWVESEVLTNDDGEVTGTFCQYRAESEE